MSSSVKRSRLTTEKKQHRLIWVDLEMSGLDVNKEHILEMACLITDSDLNVVAESEGIIINQPAHVLDNMGDWCTQHHGESGLTASVLASKISLEEAESRMVSFVREHTMAGVSPLAGNTVHMDRQFLAKYMPTFTSHLHYRIVDVSTINELCKRWYPKKLKKAPKKKLSHRALDDIKESIEELRYYKQTIFVPT